MTLRDAAPQIITLFAGCAKEIVAERGLARVVQFDPEHLRIAAKLRKQERRRLRKRRLVMLAALGFGFLIWFALMAVSLLVVWLVLFKWEF